MINKLTTEQESKIPLFIEKWINIASEPIDKTVATKYMKLLYKEIKETEPIIIYGQSPLSTSIMACIFWNIFKNLKKNELDSQLDSQLYSQLYSQLGSQLYSQLGSQLRSQLYSQLYSQLDSQLDSQLGSQLYSQLGSQLYSQLYSQLDSQLDSQLYSQLYSQLGSQLKNINVNWYLSMWWLVWCGWYDYGKYIGIKFNKQKYDLFINFVKEIGFFIPYKNICFVSEKPKEIHWNNGLLHKDGSPAVLYNDGYSLHSLNGIRVPKYLAETPAGKLDIEFFKQEKNADVKAEFVRKYGIERMESLGKVTDIYKNYPTNEWWQKSEYTLIDMSPIFSSVKYAPYLKMRNQTTGIFHLEPVSPECKNLKEAFEKTRWNGRKIDEYLTENIK